MMAYGVIRDHYQKCPRRMLYVCGELVTPWRREGPVGRAISCVGRAVSPRGRAVSPRGMPSVRRTCGDDGNYWG